MIKLQGKICSEHTSDVVNDDVKMVCVSLDSYDGEALSREEKGGEQYLKAPDFTVVKVTASLHNNCILMIIKVKCFEMSLELAQDQILMCFQTSTSSLMDNLCLITWKDC